MIILDTSVWIEFFKKKTEIFTRVKKLLESQKVYALECIFGELLQGAKDDRERNVIISYWNNLPKPDEREIWIEAGKYSGENKLLSKGVGLIDVIIILSVIQSKAKVWTLDKKLLKTLHREIMFSI